MFKSNNRNLGMGTPKIFLKYRTVYRNKSDAHASRRRKAIFKLAYFFAATCPNDLDHCRSAKKQNATSNVTVQTW